VLFVSARGRISLGLILRGENIFTVNPEEANLLSRLANQQSYFPARKFRRTLKVSASTPK
jgi:hypothetical protein